MTLKRKKYKLPSFVHKALNESKLLKVYKARPAYQQNDYIGWISRGKLEETKKKRLAQMLSELKRGDKYMKMKYSAIKICSRGHRYKGGGCPICWKGNKKT